MKVYLSGGMEYAEGEGVKWRQELQSWIENNLEHECFNPNTESDKFFSTEYPGVDFRAIKSLNVELYKQITTRLVEIDTTEIAQRTSYLVCYWDNGAAKGAGTKGELTMAKFFNKPVYVVTSFSPQEIPGWILGCTTEFFSSFDDLKIFLTKKFTSR
jgi:hypothetical protein